MNPYPENPDPEGDIKDDIQKAEDALTRDEASTPPTLDDAPRVPGLSTEVDAEGFDGAMTSEERKQAIESLAHAAMQDLAAEEKLRDSVQTESNADVEADREANLADEIGEVPIAWEKSKTDKEIIVRPSPMQSLLVKLDQWLMAQPEWPALFLADRRTRREAATLVAKHILTIPTRGSVPGRSNPGQHITSPPRRRGSKKKKGRR